MSALFISHRRTLTEQVHDQLNRTVASAEAGFPGYKNWNDISRPSEECSEGPQIIIGKSMALGRLYKKFIVGRTIGRVLPALLSSLGVSGRASLSLHSQPKMREDMGERKVEGDTTCNTLVG